MATAAAGTAGTVKDMLLMGDSFIDSLHNWVLSNNKPNMMLDAWRLSIDWDSV